MSLIFSIRISLSHSLMARSSLCCWLFSLGPPFTTDSLRSSLIGFDPIAVKAELDIVAGFVKFPAATITFSFHCLVPASRWLAFMTHKFPSLFTPRPDQNHPARNHGVFDFCSNPRESAGSASAHRPPAGNKGTRNTRRRMFRSGSRRCCTYRCDS